MHALLDYLCLPEARAYRDACNAEDAARDAAQIAREQRHLSEVAVLSEIKRRLNDNPVPSEVLLLHQKRRQVRELIQLRGELGRLHEFKAEGLL